MIELYSKFPTVYLEFKNGCIAKKTKNYMKGSAPSLETGKI